MEDWENEALQYFWKKMKIDSCLMKEYYDPSDGHLHRSYEFPNGLIIECILEKEGISYLTMKFKVAKKTVDIIMHAIENRNVSSNELGQVLEFIIEVFSQGELMEILWDLYQLDPTPRFPRILREYQLECPYCKTLISFESAESRVWLKCRNCTNEIFIDGSGYSEMGN